MFDFDICAPHITIPECFTDENSVMIVFDLGRLQFRNLSPKLMLAAEQKQSLDEDGQTNMLFLFTFPKHMNNFSCETECRHSV